MVISFSLLSALNVKQASKDELVCIKGIGEKKAAAIIKFRKSKTFKSVDDLLELKGFGKGLVNNLKKDIKTVACGGKKSAKKKTSTTTSSSKKTDTKKTTESK